MLWALCLGLAGALLTAGVERTRAASARAEASTARKDLAEFRATQAESGRLAERAARNTEQTWRARVDGVIQDGQKQIAAARADAASAADAERRLRTQLAAFRAAVRTASTAPTPAEGGAAAADPLDLLADLFGRADARAGELARIADERGAAGTTCERHADATESK
ncbi:DUF2514 family protein [Variovorax paradoxus]|uniref:DUF2514 family protein n=1 Tax=Variovorax paradoxus TaxID=34073 RepID=UPI0009B5E94B|nr:DUF2514 family protein [Variovorax paradoxus]